MQTKVQGTRRAIKRTKVWKMMCLLFMLLLFSNLTAHNDLLQLGSVCRNCSIILFRFRGRYLSRRIAYPSNGSFNPFIISNKEAHIVNGNINSEATKVLEEKRNDSTDSVCTYMYEGSNVRDHFCNYCLTNVGKFSCAVDCFLELCCFVFRNHLQNITCKLSLSCAIKGKILVLLTLCESLYGH